MTTFGLLAAVLQLSVPSYAFRLVRRFGAQQVGWFVVTSFCCLALFHLLAPLGRLAITPELPLHAALAITSVLLVVGMGHVEAVWSERDKARRAQHEAQTESETQFIHRTHSLERTNHLLIAELQQLREREQALAESAAQYDLLFRANPQPLCVAGRTTAELLAVNASALKLFGWSAENVARTCFDCITADSAEFFEVQLRPDCPEPRSLGQWQHCRSDGTLLDIEISAVDLTFAGRAARLLVFHNVSNACEQRERETRNELLARVSRISGSLGESLADTLNPIEQNTARLLARIQDGACTELLRQVSTAAHRGLGLSRQLRAIGGCHPMTPEVVDINALLRTMNPLLARLLGERIILQNAFGPFAAPVLADSRLIEHVIVNLVLNARDAISSQGSIMLSTALFRVEAAPLPGIAAGPFVRISIRDTGKGLDAAAREHLFEPFFTTRPSGALGLGLAGSFGLARQHGGWIESNPDCGTGSEFFVYLPCAPAAANETAAAARDGTPTLGTILLVQADDRVRASARCALTWKGFRVIEADSTALALLLWEAQAAAIDVLLTDASLSDGITGRALGEQLQASKPGLAVVCLADVDATPAETQDRWRTLAKPVTSEELVLQVEKLVARTD
ncbi:MAG TPA: ATP-binding protein [Verrucomicrobiae bacterium]|nr:ATP-binding protein [Verrucomicrobiae bacterium]